jgi:hypothetical protein
VGSITGRVEWDGVLVEELSEISNAVFDLFGEALVGAGGFDFLSDEVRIIGEVSETSFKLSLDDSVEACLKGFEILALGTNEKRRDTLVVLVIGDTEDRLGSHVLLDERL